MLSIEASRELQPDKPRRGAQTSGKLLDLYWTGGPVTTWKIQVLLVLQNFYRTYSFNVFYIKKNSVRSGDLFCIFWYQKFIFLISENKTYFLISKKISIFYIKNIFWYQKINFWYQKINVFYIKKSIFWYQKIDILISENRKIDFLISKDIFWYQKNRFFDIKNIE